MNYIVHPNPGKRLHYIANLIFGEILEAPFRVISERPRLEANDTVLQYGGSSNGNFEFIQLPQNQRFVISNGVRNLDFEDHFALKSRFLASFAARNDNLFDVKTGSEIGIPACGLLEDSFGIKKIQTPDENGIHGDLLAGAFWWATGYGYQYDPQYDEHGRYAFERYSHIQQGLHHTPWVHIYAHKIAQLLQLPLVKRAEKKPQITFDIDHPWLFNQKPIGVTVGSLLKKISRADLQGAQSQLKALFTQHDPTHTFETIFELTEPAQSTFFFLIERRHPYDTRHTWRNKAYRSLIQDIHRRGYSIGIHPSYTTFLKPAYIKEETDRLAQIIGEPIVRSRMHFLKYRQPDTYRSLLDAGIRHDYTTGFYHDTGFVHGMAQAFFWFDLEKNIQTELRLHPTHAMDRTFLSYLKISPEEAGDQILALHNTIKAVNGEMLMLFHNESLSDFGEWKDWKKAIKAMLMLT